MAEWNLGFTALRIAKLFAESTGEKHCCTEITKQLNVPQQTAWNALQSMKSASILSSEKPYVGPQAYRFTDSGRRIALESLAAVQFHGTILVSS